MDSTVRYEMNDRIFLKDPNEHPFLGRWRRFDQGEAMEHFISGADPCPEWIRGLLDVQPKGIAEWLELPIAFFVGA